MRNGLPILVCPGEGMLSVTSNARMLWAFSRDGAVPFSSFFHKVDQRTKVPLNAVWGMAFFAALLGCARTCRSSWH